MSKLEELRKDLVTASDEIERLRKLNDDEKHEWTAEDEQAYTRSFDAFDEAKLKYETEQRNAKADEVKQYMDAADDPHGLTRQDTPPPNRDEDRSNGPTEEDRNLAMQGWMRARTDAGLEERHIEACRRVGLNPNQRALNIGLMDQRALAELHRLSEMRALTTQTGSSGKFTIPQGFVPSIEVALKKYGGPRQVATVFRTSTGNDLPWPTSDDTSNKGELVGENTATNEQDVVFGQIMFNAYKYSSKMIKVPFELLQDSAFDLASWLAVRLGERIGRITAEHFTVGTGSGQPNGLVTASTLGVSAAGAAAIASDELINLQHSIDPAYRIDAGFMLHDSTLLALRKLKDGDGNYLISMGNYQTGLPANILGDPYTVNQDMPQMATGLKSVLYGDYTKYQIRDVANLRFVRADERFVENDQVVFIAWFRTDGDLVDAGTNPVKHLIQA